MLTRTGEGATWTKAPSGLPSGGADGQVLTHFGGSATWASPTGRWDLDSLAMARGYHEVLSSTEPATVQYTASNGQTYPVVWVKARDITVPVLPEEPYWNRAAITVSVPALVGIDYFVTGWKKGTATTWNELNVKLTPAMNVGITTVTGQSLPVSVRVEARAQPGYEMPKTFVYTHDFPDPTAVVVVTSDTFTGGDVANLNARMSDAGLGGSPRAWYAPLSSTVAISDGMAVVNAGGGSILMDVGAKNIEVEYDLIRRDGLPGKISLDWLNVRVGASTAWNTGFGTNGPRVYDGSLNLSDPNAKEYMGPTPDLGYPGRYKISIVGQTGSITCPSGAVYTVTTKESRAEDQTMVAFNTYGGGYPKVAFDNVVFRQIGF